MDSNEVSKPVQQITEVTSASTSLSPSASVSASSTDCKLNLDVGNHLHSLELTLANGKPRFKLNEPVTSSSIYQSTTQMNDYTIIDPNDTLSFVVLGKDSMSAIQEMSAASYTDIQNKSMSIDYNSIVSSLTAAEIQKKLIELLQENSMLKETLEQSNIAMKKQFNNAISWQEAVMKVHENHKQKFAETRELINNLRQENSQLKEKLLGNEESAMKDVPKIKNETEEEVKGSEYVTDLEEQLSSLTKQLVASKQTCAQLSESVKKYESLLPMAESYFPLIKKEKLDIFPRTVPSDANEEFLESNKFTMLGTSTSQNVENQKLLIDCLQKDKEIAVLKSEVNTLEQKLKCVISPMQITVNQLTESPSTLERQQFVQNVNEYNEKLQVLNKCYVSQIARYSNIQECLKKCTDTIEIIENIRGSIETGLSHNATISPIQEKLSACKEQLSNFHSELAEEQVNIISDRQCLIRAQSQFQKILSDYHSILYKMEVTLEENTKLETMKRNIARETHQKLSEMEMCCSKDKQAVEVERQSLSQEKESLLAEKMQLLEEKELLIKERCSLKAQFKMLDDEKQLLEQERNSLHEEKTSLDQQSQLYETHEMALLTEKKSWEKKSAQLIEEVNSLNENLMFKQLEIAGLERKLAQQVENMELLRTQMALYEEDYVKEKELRENTLKEKAEVQAQLQNFLHQVTKNSVEIFECPKCLLLFQDLKLLQEHVEACLELK